LAVNFEDALPIDEPEEAEEEVAAPAKRAKKSAPVEVPAEDTDLATLLDEWD